MPSILRRWSEVKPRLASGRLAVFLDFDGTLAPIVRQPGQAAISPCLRRTLSRLSACPGVRVGVVSGRSLTDLKKRVRLRKIAYAGNHGLEIEGTGFRFRLRTPPDYPRTLARVRVSIAGLPSVFPGTEIEDKGLTLSFHYRRANRLIVPEAVAAFRRAVRPYQNRLQIRTGKRILEIRPPAPWGKGEAVLWLLSNQVWLPGRMPTTAVYIGDDRTDEDAFRALRDDGVTIRVGRSVRSAARYTIDDTESTARFLDRLVRLREGSK